MALPALYTKEPLLNKDWYTEDEYFALEDRSPDRWEFLPDGPPDALGPRMGRIRAMSGGTLDHGGIGGNLVTALNVASRGAGIQTCRVFGSDVKVHPPEGRNTYPDVSVLCGKPDLYRGRNDIFTNPIFVAEVLSPSTETYDRKKAVGLPDHPDLAALPPDYGGPGAGGALHARRGRLAFGGIRGFGSRCFASRARHDVGVGRPL